MSSNLISTITSINRTLIQFSVLLPAIIPVLINLWVTNIDQRSVRSQNWNKEYDIIIVGAGTAGALIAGQLAANTKHKILLLEAGSNHNFFAEIPAFSHLLRGTPLDWQFVTEPQDNACLGLEGQRSRWPSGRTMGGSSSIGDMLYVNGIPQSYDEWEQLGAEGWAWNDVKWHFPVWEMKYAKKDITEEEKEEEIQQRIEENHIISSNLNKGLLKNFREASRHMNHTFLKFNTKSNVGFSLPILSIKEGRRYSSAQLLKPVLKNDNLDVVNYALVEKIIIENMTATAVQFTRFGFTYTAKAKYEIILSAGAINSPKILMLSGIGPKDHLKAVNIPLVKDLPVGHNLQDQVSTQLSFTVKRNSVVNAYKNLDLKSFLKYLLFSEGLLSSAQIDLIGLINASNQTDPNPNIQFILRSFAISSDVSFKKMLGINDNLWQTYEKYGNKDTISFEVKLLNPKSRGRVELLSSDPTSAPKIDPKYYSKVEDLTTIRNGLKFISKMIKSKPLMSLRADPFGEPKECEKLEPESNQFYECLARYLTLSGHSPIGTCRMGDPSSTDAVVDPQLRVIGINGLRVADASVMPSHTSGAPMAAIQMIGEKMANMVMERDSEEFKQKFDRLQDLVEDGFQMAYKFFTKTYGL